MHFLLAMVVIWGVAETHQGYMEAEDARLMTCCNFRRWWPKLNTHCYDRPPVHAGGFFLTIATVFPRLK
jgi:hypothetical protein